MNLPRHSLTSHAPKPTFVNVHFSECDVVESSFGFGSAGDEIDKRRPLNDHAESVGRRQRQQRQQQQQQSKERWRPRQQRKAMLTCATRQGFFVAHVDPFKMLVRREFTELQGGLAHASLIDDSSLMVLVGGGRVPRFAPNKVILWDEDATVKIPLPPYEAKATGVSLSFDRDGESDGTASPAPSTLFSMGQEQDRESEQHEDKEDEERISSSVEDVDQEKESEVTSSHDSLENVEPAPDCVPTQSEEDNDAADSKQHEVDGNDLSDSNVLASSHLAQSISASLSASSANMEDPFGAPSPVEESIEHEKDESSAYTGPSDPYVPIPPSAKSRHEEKQDDEEQRFRIEKGREVAELEFGEAVQSITVRTFEIDDIADGDVDGDAPSLQKPPRTSILVVSLQRKAVIFEMGPLLNEENGQASRSSWGIKKRLTVDVYAGSSHCAPVMASVAGANCALVALPGRQMGHVQLLSIAFSQTTRTTIGSSIAGASTIIAAHSNAITNIALSNDGRVLCTASERGTLLRLWSTVSRSGGAAARSRQTDTLNVALMGELRRGTDAARMLSVTIAPDLCVLAAASEKGTIHLFDLTSVVDQQGRPVTNKERQDASTRFTNNGRTGSQGRSFTLSRQAERYLPNALHNFAQSIPASLLPQYFTSQWSFAQYRITLKTFSGRSGDEVRHVEAPLPKQGRTTTTSTTGEEATLTSIGEAIIPQKALNLDGGWATMRGRVSDIRRGERSIQESIWLTFVSARHDLPSSDSHPPTAAPSEKQGASYDYHLIAVTSSGQHYRLGLRLPLHDAAAAAAASATVEDRPSKSSTVLDMYRSDSSSSRSSDRDAADHTLSGSCWLVEHARFGVRDAWLD